MMNLKFKTALGILSLPLVAGIVNLGWLFGAEKAKAVADSAAITHVDAAAAAKLVAEKKVVVLDIRTPKEYAAGHLAGALNIDFYAADFATRNAEAYEAYVQGLRAMADYRYPEALRRFRVALGRAPDFT